MALTLSLVGHVATFQNTAHYPHGVPHRAAAPVRVSARASDRFASCFAPPAFAPWSLAIAVDPDAHAIVMMVSSSRRSRGSRTSRGPRGGARRRQGCRTGTGPGAARCRRRAPGRTGRRVRQDRGSACLRAAEIRQPERLRARAGPARASAPGSGTRRAFLLEDDWMRDFDIGQPSPPPPISEDDHGHVIYLRSASKPIAAGLRVSRLAACGPVLARLRRGRISTTCSWRQCSSRSRSTC